MLAYKEVEQIFSTIQQCQRSKVYVETGKLTSFYQKYVDTKKLKDIKYYSPVQGSKVYVETGKLTSFYQKYARYKEVERYISTIHQYKVVRYMQKLVN